jgi:hypothetical protein
MQDSKIKAHRVYLLKYPEKCRARIKCQHLPKVDGFVNHHWSYNESDIFDIIIISKRDHKKAHKYMRYNPNFFFYMDLNGELLDTRQKHIDYINFVKTNYPDSLGNYPILEYKIN